LTRGWGWVLAFGWGRKQWWWCTRRKAARFGPCGAARTGAGRLWPLFLCLLWVHRGICGGRFSSFLRLALDAAGLASFYSSLFFSFLRLATMGVS
jgi:hypothetical protein